MGSPSRPIQGRIGQTQAFGDDGCFGLGCGQLRDCVHLIQTHFTGSESGSQDWQIFKATSYPHQLSGRGMSKAKSCRHPLDQIPSPVRQELLAQIGIDQPLTYLGIEDRHPGEQLAENPIHLIVGKPLPFHAPNIRNGTDKNGSENTHIERNLRNLWRWADPPSARPEAPDPSRCRRHRPGSRWRREPWRRSSGQPRRERRRRCLDH